MPQSHEMDVHDLHCYIHFSETASLDDALRQQVVEKLQKALAETITTDSSNWNTYCLRPLWVVEHPGSPLLAKVDPDLVERNLQWKIQIQNENGSWLRIGSGANSPACGKRRKQPGPASSPSGI